MAEVQLHQLATDLRTALGHLLPLAEAAAVKGRKTVAIRTEDLVLLTLGAASVIGQSDQVRELELYLGADLDEPSKPQGVSVSCELCGADIGTQYKPGDGMALFRAHLAAAHPGVEVG